MTDHLHAYGGPGIHVPPELSIPLVETAFRRCRHPGWADLRRHSHAWLLQQRLMPVDVARRHIHGLHYTDLIAGYYVGASTAALEAISDFSVWFFAWDDFHGRCAILHRHRAWARLRDVLHAALDAPQRYLDHAEPLVAGMADWMHRFTHLLTPSWAARFGRHFHQIIEGYEQEYGQRVAGRMPALDAYVALRRLTFGYDVWLDCLELAAGQTLPPELLAWDEYRRAGLASQEFSGWYNDLCSLPKEAAAGEIHNLGMCLMHQYGLSLPQAVAETRRRIETRVQDFLQAEAQLLRRLDAATLPTEIDRTARHCVFNMRNWTSSVYWFHHESTRYRVADWQDGARPPYVTDAQETRVP
ncbi:hypothetical protein RKE25_12445 [Dyella sp. BiH032]|uniref:terpene synthase family protein n=1 Tax=Dyella sp. BiH032 TaxID=3075430 RepID=UPI0028931B94|nr:hypothetical protein [Dyella sp. BiH032]WNL44237.1 hypothetical protein RKE25_12445 [Dyella sp. BiH032]